MRGLKIILVLWLVLALVGCSQQARLPVAGYVDLADRQPLPTQAENHIAPLRVAVAAVISPQGTVDSYSSLLQYLSARLNRPIELVQRSDYRIPPSGRPYKRSPASFSSRPFSFPSLE